MLTGREAGNDAYQQRVFSHSRQTRTAAPGRRNRQIECPKVADWLAVTQRRLRKARERFHSAANRLALARATDKSAGSWLFGQCWGGPQNNCPNDPSVQPPE